MAGANAKRVSASNAKTLQQLQLGFLVSGGLYLLHLFLSPSGRTFKRLFLFVLTETVAVSLWRWIQGEAARGTEVGKGEGMTTYMFDVIYVTWFVHVMTALVSAKFWLVYWVIPLYALYRLFLLLAPRFSPTLAALLASTQQGAQAGAGGLAQGPIPANQPQPTSKRQEKLRKRAEKGDRRVQYMERKTGQTA